MDWTERNDKAVLIDGLYERLARTTKIPLSDPERESYRRQLMQEITLQLSLHLWPDAPDHQKR